MPQLEGSSVEPAQRSVEQMLAEVRRSLATAQAAA
jgi:hypothetical protein